MAKASKTDSPTPADSLIDYAQRVRVASILRIRGAKGAGESNAILDDPFAESSLYNSGDTARHILVPPMGEGSLRTLSDMIEESNILGQCVQAYQTNIDGFGHKLELAVKSEDFPKEKKDEADAEKERLEEFFTYCFAEGSFPELRQRLRRDIETSGPGYIEVLRDQTTGFVNRLNHVPSHTMRQTVYDKDQVVVTEHRQVGLDITDAKVARRFRTFVQIQYGAGRKEEVWFKEFGDPRAMDKTTGKWKAKGDKTNLATEIISFRCTYNATSPYSVPRWAGNLPSILGSRAAEEINLLYFDNKAIPPMVVTVSGGALTKGTVKRIENLINYKLKGRENFHEPLILEAMPVQDGSGKSAAPRVEIKPLTDAAIKDALFMGYDGENRKKVRSSFRLTPLYTGESEDLTRATAEASMQVVEEQVFRPERVAFDYVVNRWLMPELGAKYHKFVSVGPNVTLNEDLVAALTAGETAGSMTPNIGRRLLADITESDIPQIAEPWGDVPFSLTLAQVKADALAQAALLGGFPGGGAPGTGQEPPAAPAPGKAFERGLERRLREAARGYVLEAMQQELKRRKAKREG